jgi:GTP-binding protein
MLVDEAFITVKGGHGGPGKASFFPGFRTSPDGGDGGFGGAVYARANPHMVTLERFTSQTKFAAENGQAGESFRRHGRNGRDLYLDLPVGTLLRDAHTKEEYELLKPGQEILLVKGGKGGKGNDFFKSSTNVSPRQFQPGLDGKMRQFKLIMRLIADFGFIGLPNAGKSSLLNELTAANVKTANYPFTTITPNLGSLYGTILADIPGLIEGAHEGKGLGSRFLKHIEKVKAVLHCVASDSEDMVKDYETIRHELAEFNPKLAEKPEIILITKLDLVTPAELKKLVTKMKKKNKDVYTVSIHDLDSIENLKKIIIKANENSA